ncbi:MAG TPA: ABC transporter transmembrane domain-containing protein [Chloroflexota bacterium]|nr:ABC transporter transmembrane domain-containing protein [Chloroflexota bacterium]
MPIADALPAAAEQQWRAIAAPDEEVMLTVASDLTTRGDYGPRWLVITNKRVIVLPEVDEAEPQHLPLDALTDAKTEALVGGGRLEVYTGNVPIPLVEYSSSLGPKFSEVARGLQQVIKGQPFRVSDDIPPLRCDRCGRLLADKNAPCSRCTRRMAMLMRLLSYMKPVWPLSLLLALATGGRTIAQLAPPYFQKLMIDQILTPPLDGGPAKPTFGDSQLLVLYVLGMAGAGLATALLMIVGAWLAAVVGTRVTLDIRGQLYRTLERLSLTFHNRREQGALMSLVTRDTDQLNYFLIEGLPYLVTNSLLLVAIVAILLSMNWMLTLFILVPAPFVILGGGIIWRRLRQYWSRWSHSWSLFTAHLGESLAGIRVSKAFHQENAEINRFDRRNADLAEITIREGRFWGGSFAVLNFLTGTGAYIAWVAGGSQVIAGRMTLGEIVAFVGYLWLLYGPLQWFNQIYQWMSRAFAGAERIFEVIDTPPERYGDANAVTIERIKGEVEFRDVTFGYDKAKPVLKDVSLHVQPGEMIGLVGKSGTGKSTFVNLICRFYEADHGEILIDGHDVKDVSLECLREQVGVVLQEPFLFNGTIAENIRYARPQATERQVIAAARAANAHDFVVAKPDGYDTYVGEKGSRLSVGEKQRISIARAILRDPRILILDEATASVDTETEKAIQEALARLVKGRTTFAIAHRLSTLRNADRLVVFDDGKIVEVGTHEELLERHGVYWKLVEMQSEVNKIRTVAA